MAHSYCTAPVNIVGTWMWPSSQLCDHSERAARRDPFNAMQISITHSAEQPLKSKSVQTSK